MTKGYESSCCLWCSKYHSCRERPTKTRSCCPAPSQKSAECVRLVADGYCTVCHVYEKAGVQQITSVDGQVLTATQIAREGRKGAKPAFKKGRPAPRKSQPRTKALIEGQQTIPGAQ